MPEKLTLRKVQQVAEGRDGKCLATKYTNSGTRIRWRCASGHEWSATTRDVKRGSWCPKCGVEQAARKRSLGIDAAHVLAKSRGGKCLSVNYKNNLTPLKWQCRYGHTWKARYSNVNNGTWCPECSSGLGERICRAHFEQIFGNEFPKAFPEWLINQEGNQMELDGYCPDWKLAFEHQGRQHYKRVRSYHTKASLQKRIRDDQDKVRLCDKHGIVLVAVPEIPSDLKVRDVSSFLHKFLKKRRFKNIPRDIHKKKIRLKQVYISGPLETFKELKTICKKRGGKCLSREYFGHQSALEIRCAEGHEWTARAGHILKGHWCAACAKRKKLTIGEMQKVATSKGGKCLSKRYVNARTPLKWQCGKGHIWKAPPGTINAGRWCIQCAGTAKGTIAEMRAIARERGGRCLSKQYWNANTKLEWRCSKGHEWKATPHTIKRPSWCPKCGGQKAGDHFRLGIEKMRKLAQEKGGSCLSDTYVNDHTRLKWRCSKGHEWEAMPGNVTRGSWCPDCFAIRRSKGLRRRTA